MKKILVSCIAALICLIGLLVLFLPSVLSSNVGKNYLIRNIEQSSKAKVEIGNVSFSWARAQEIQDFSLEIESELHFCFDSLTLDTSFWNLLFRNGSLGKTSLVKPDLTLHAKTVTSSPQEPKEIFKESQAKKKKKNLWSNLRGKINIRDATFAMQQEGADLIRIDKVNFELGMAENLFPLSLRTEGNTKHQELLGHFEAKAVINSQDTLEIDGEANISNFPVAGIDALIALLDPSLKGFLTQSFGDNLNLDLFLSKIEDGEKISLHLRSPRMNVSLLANYQKGMIHLREPMYVAWTIRPRLIEALSPSLSFTPIGEIKGEVNLENLNLKFENFKFDTSSLAADGKMKIEQGALTLKKTKDTILLDELEIAFQTARLEELINLTFQNTFRFSSFPKTTVQGSADLAELLSDKGFLSKIRGIDLNVRNFPTLLVDILGQSEGGLQKWIGSNFDLKAKQSKEEGEDYLVLNGGSPLLNLSTSHFALSEKLTLLSPASFTYQLTPKLWDQIADQSVLSGSLESFTLPLSDFSESTFKVKVNTQDFQIKDLVSLGMVNLPALNCELEGSLSEVLVFKGDSRLDFAPKTWGHTLFGKDTELQVAGNITVKDPFKISPLNIKLDGKKIKTSAAMSLNTNGVTLKTPLNIDFSLEPSEINLILSKEGNFPHLVESTPFQLQLKPGTFPFNPEALSKLKFHATGQVELIKMMEPTTRFPFSFEKVDLSFDLDGKKKVSELQFEAKAFTKESRDGNLELLVQNSEGSFNPLNDPSRVQLKMSKVSSQIADALLQMRGTLPPMIGSWLDFHCDIDKKEAAQEMNVTLKSPYLNAEGAFLVRDTFTLKSSGRPLKLEWNFSEEGVQSFQRWRNPSKSIKRPDFVVADRAKMKVSISPLTLPLKEKKGLFPSIDANLYHAIFDADMRIDSLSFKQDQAKEITELNRFDLNLSKTATLKPLSFKMQGHVSPHGASSSGTINGEGTLDHFITEAGDIDLEDVTASIHARVQHLPTVFIDALSNINGSSGSPPSAFLGEMLNASFDVELMKENGKLNIDVDGTNCRALLNATVANGILYLNEPLKAAMTISPKMNRILADGPKIVVSSMKSPISLVIQEKGFSIPLKDLSLKQANLSHGMIDFGQIVCRNTGSASDISGIFKMEGNQNLISLWFAPMEFSIRRGLMAIDRTELLYNRAYQVALWGNVNFARRYVAMTLGLTAQSLRAALGIRDLDANYVLQVPVEGPFDDVRIDKGAATSKIALLIARKQVAPKAGVWGQVFGAIGGLGDDQSNVPPAKPPFPWQNILNMQELTTTESQLDKRFKKKAKAYLKEIKEGFSPTDVSTEVK